MESGEEIDEKTKAEMAQKHSAMLMDLMYNMAVIDIEATLEKVCWKVLHDRSVPKVVRKQRAHAMKIVGNVFQSFGGTRRWHKRISKENGYDARWWSAAKCIIRKISKIQTIYLLAL